MGILLVITFFIYCTTWWNSVICNDGASTHHKLVYRWMKVDFDWPNDTMKQQYIADGNYVPENNAINGIKVYNGTVYVTIPKLKGGVPTSLSVILDKGSIDSPVLRPYPDWNMHKIGDCNSLQHVQSMEVDHNTGYMWILDTSYLSKEPVDVVTDKCPAKLVIYDIANDVEVHRHIFETSVVGKGLFYLNDIVLDRGENGQTYAYISDTLGWKLVVYDRNRDKSHQFTSMTMMPQKSYAKVTISNDSTQVNPLGINGIAISADFQYVYYSAVAGVALYQIPTSLLRNFAANNNDFDRHVRSVGNKISQGDGMYYGNQHNLYFSTLGKNAVYKWPIEADMASQGRVVSQVKMETQTVVAKDARMEWVDSLGMDEEGYLWFTTNNLHTYFGNDTGEWNFYVWKVFVNESSYLNQTGVSRLEDAVQGSSTIVISIWSVLLGVAFTLFI